MEYYEIGDVEDYGLCKDRKLNLENSDMATFNIFLKKTNKKTINTFHFMG